MAKRQLHSLPAVCEKEPPRVRQEGNADRLPAVLGLNDCQAQLVTCGRKLKFQLAGSAVRTGCCCSARGQEPRLSLGTNTAAPVSRAVSLPSPAR